MTYTDGQLPDSEAIGAARFLATRGARRTAMYIKFWGVRGSTPTPQMENLRYGGNTSSVEVRLNGQGFIFDCGTRFRNLGKQLAPGANRKPLLAHIFISHFHLGHIPGIPFFVP